MIKESPALNIDSYLTHPDKILYPEQDITKRELASYYESISEWILPHIIDRPLSLLRCPQGKEKTCFFQKHVNAQLSEGLSSIRIKEKDQQREYYTIQSVHGLIALVQMNVLEIHPWNCLAKSIEYPDRMIFDLDPDASVPWTNTIELAHLIYTMLDKVGLKSFVKTSGNKGLHIVVPIEPKNTWEEVKDFSFSLAKYVVNLKPEKYTVLVSKAKRTDKIFIDYLRNNRGATTVAAYSTRAKKYAPVSMPLSWNELDPKIKPNSFNINNAIKRLNHLKEDPWHDFFKIKQTINLS